MAGDDFFDQLYGEFYVHFPCYAVMAEDGSGFLAESAGDGTTALALLTDDDLLRRYREARGTVGIAVPVADAGRLRRFLRALPARITHVTFDPGPHVHRRFPVGVLRAHLSEAVER